MNLTAFSPLAVLSATFPLAANAQQILLEAEQFDKTGGWDVDQQLLEVMGSSYLLAQGPGVPVKDAVTKATFPSSGAYRVWVRTRDWVSPWKAPGAPGKFQVLIHGKPLATTFGTEGEQWHWQDGAWIAVRHPTTPRGVYEKHLPLLKELMQQPGVMRRDKLYCSLK